MYNNIIYYLRCWNTTVGKYVHRSDATARNARVLRLQSRNYDYIVDLVACFTCTGNNIVCLCFTQFQRRRIIMPIVVHSEFPTRRHKKKKK